MKKTRRTSLFSLDHIFIVVVILICWVFAITMIVSVHRNEKSEQKFSSLTELAFENDIDPESQLFDVMIAMCDTESEEDWPNTDCLPQYIVNKFLYWTNSESELSFITFLAQDLFSKSEEAGQWKLHIKNKILLYHEENSLSYVSSKEARQSLPNVKIFDLNGL